MSLEKALSKLPAELEPGAVVSAVQQQLIDRLAKLRYNPPPTTQAQRPKKKDKLPAGEAYTCGLPDAAEPPMPATRRRSRKDSSNSDSSIYSDESSGEEDRRQAVRTIVKKLGKKRPREEEEESSSEEDEEAAEEIEQNQQQEEEHAGNDLQEKQQQAQAPASAYLPGSYIVAMYQGDWFVGQVMDKNGEPEAEEGEEYLLVNFMERTGGDRLKWPARLDILNTLKDDVLFSCLPPTPCVATSSSRSTTFSLTPAETKKANILYKISKAYYPIQIFFTFLQNASVGNVCVVVGTYGV